MKSHEQKPKQENQSHSIMKRISKPVHSILSCYQNTRLNFSFTVLYLCAHTHTHRRPFRRLCTVFFLWCFSLAVYPCQTNTNQSCRKFFFFFSYEFLSVTFSRLLSKHTHIKKRKIFARFSFQSNHHPMACMLITSQMMRYSISSCSIDSNWSRERFFVWFRFSFLVDMISSFQLFFLLLTCFAFSLTYDLYRFYQTFVFFLSSLSHPYFFSSVIYLLFSHSRLFLLE